VLIAGEGRKFGLHLFIASQRPGKVHPNVLSQCDNLLLMRMNGAADVTDLESVFSHVPPMLLREAFTFGLGQALVAGPLAPLPVIAQIGSRCHSRGWRRRADHLDQCADLSQANAEVFIRGQIERSTALRPSAVWAWMT